MYIVWISIGDDLRNIDMSHSNASTNICTSINELREQTNK